MKCKSVSVLLKPRFVEKLLAPKQESLCMICACELFWLIHILSCSVTCDRLYGKKDRKTKEAPQGSFLFQPVPLQSRSQKNSRARVLLQRVLLQSTHQKYQRAMAQRGNLLLQSKGRAKLSRTVLHPSCTAVVYLRLAMATKANNC